MALPSFYDLDDPSSNLAAAFDVPRAVPTPTAQRYYVGDGTTIGYGGTCQPITAENELSGLGELDLYDITEYVPEVLQEARITWMGAFSMPLTVAALAYAMNRRPLTIVALSAASYMAPYPAALAVAFMAAGPKLRGLRAGRNVRRTERYTPPRRKGRRNRYARA